MFCVLMSSFSPILPKNEIFPVAFILHFLQNSGRVPDVCLKLARCTSWVKRWREAKLISKQSLHHLTQDVQRAYGGPYMSSEESAKWMLQEQERKRSELTAQNKQKERNKKEHFKNGMTLRTEWP